MWLKKKKKKHEQVLTLLCLVPPDVAEFISSRFFENEPNGICSHLSEKGSKGRFCCAREARKSH